MVMPEHLHQNARRIENGIRQIREIIARYDLRNETARGAYKRALVASACLANEEIRAFIKFVAGADFPLDILALASADLVDADGTVNIELLALAIDLLPETGNGIRDTIGAGDTNGATDTSDTAAAGDSLTLSCDSLTLSCDSLTLSCDDCDDTTGDIIDDSNSVEDAAAAGLAAASTLAADYDPADEVFSGSDVSQIQTDVLEQVFEAPVASAASSPAWTIGLEESGGAVALDGVDAAEPIEKPTVEAIETAGVHVDQAELTPAEKDNPPADPVDSVVPSEAALDPTAGLKYVAFEQLSSVQRTGLKSLRELGFASSQADEAGEFWIVLVPEIGSDDISSAPPAMRHQVWAIREHEIVVERCYRRGPNWYIASSEGRNLAPPAGKNAATNRLLRSQFRGEILIGRRPMSQ